MAFLKRSADYYATHLEARYGAPRVTDEGGADWLEDQLRVRLPLAYREFLLWADCEPGGLFVGSECRVTDVLENKEVLRELLLLNELDSLVVDWGNIVVFFSHQGYQGAWFVADGSDDPPISYFIEGVSPRDSQSGRPLFAYDCMDQFLIGQLECFRR